MSSLLSCLLQNILDYLPYLWNHPWCSSKHLKHHLRDDHRAWPLRSSGTVDRFSASTKLPGTELSISLETAPELQNRFVQKLNTIWNSVRSIRIARCSSRWFFSNRNTHHSKKYIYAVYYPWKHCVYLFKEGNNYKWQYSIEGLKYC